MAISVLDQEKINRIKQELRWYPSGMTISNISSKIKMNRNLVAKYLDILLISGQVKIEVTGTAKVYSLSQRVPISTLMDIISDMVIVLDNELQIIRVNEKLQKALHLQKDLLLGKKIDEINIPLFVNLPIPMIKGKTQTMPSAVIERTGMINKTMCQYRILISPVVFDDGSKGTILVIGEIVSRPTTPLLPDLGVSSYQGVVEDPTEFIMRFLPDGTLTFVNDSFSQYLQTDSENLLGRSILPMFPDEERDYLMKIWQRLNHNNPASSLECRMIGPLGISRLNRWTVMALFNDDGSIREFLGIGRDITDNCHVASLISQYAADHAFLHRKACEFADLPDDADIWNVIGTGLKEILPDAIIAVNSFDPKDIAVTNRCFLGRMEREFFSKMIGEDVVGMVVNPPAGFDRDRATRDLMSGKVTKIPGNLYVVFFGRIPRAVSEKIEEVLRIGDVYMIGLLSRGVPISVAILILRKGDVLSHVDLIETYIKQATLGLISRLADTPEIKREQGQKPGAASPEDSGSSRNEKIPVVFKPHVLDN